MDGGVLCQQVVNSDVRVCRCCCYCLYSGYLDCGRGGGNIVEWNRTWHSGIVFVLDHTTTPIANMWDVQKFFTFAYILHPQIRCEAYVVAKTSALCKAHNPKRPPFPPSCPCTHLHPHPTSL